MPVPDPADLHDPAAVETATSVSRGTEAGDKPASIVAIPPRVTALGGMVLVFWKPAGETPHRVLHIGADALSLPGWRQASAAEREAALGIMVVSWLRRFLNGGIDV